MTAAIHFEHVYKKFVIYQERLRSLQELALSALHRQNGRGKDFWALRDVSFLVEHGDTVGLIDPNGAGKSTILKLISRIIDPTSGQIAVDGRVGALLELGAGFHPDLSGRENVYLYGSILGLSRNDIRRRLDKIIEFAELERFIDMPVKHYSSGMFVRLGFSVAIHTDPEVLLVDEVLAVGDEAFQHKCLDRIARLQQDGITILLVSHSLDLVRRVCKRACWLERAQVAAIGDVDDVIGAYLRHVRGTLPVTQQQTDQGQHGQRWGSHEAEITDVSFCDVSGIPRTAFAWGEGFCARIQYCAHQPIPRPTFGVAVHTPDGKHLTGPNSAESGYNIEVIEGTGEVIYAIDSLPLQPGTYQFTAAIYDCNSVHPFDHHHRMYSFSVLPLADGHRAEGLVHLPCRWEHRPA